MAVLFEKPLILNLHEPAIQHPPGTLSTKDVCQVLPGTQVVCINDDTENLEHLPSIDGIEWISTSCLKPEFIKAIEKMRGLRLFLIEDLSRKYQLSRIKAKVPYWCIFRCSQMRDFDWIGEEKSVYAINVSGCMKLDSLSGVERFQNMKELCISGSMSTSNTFEHLEPLGRLERLTHLNISCKVKSKSLAPIAKMKSLVYLSISNRFKTQDYQEILDGCKKLKSIDLGVGTFSREHGFVKSM